MVYSGADGFVYEDTDGFFDDEINGYVYDDADDRMYDEEVGGFIYEAYENIGALTYEWVDSQAPRQIDGLTVGVLALILCIAIGIWMDRDENKAMPAAPVRPAVTSQTAQPLPAAPAPVAPVDPAAIAAPYDNYILTQGLHGYSYGHMAIDIKAGKGAVINSPVDGVVTALYVDEIGNPTLVIENDIYQITMLHGEYTVAVGDRLKMGQPVGAESNSGNTKDMWGVSCRGRDCGYHTHLNVFDKRIGANVNPLDLLTIPPGS